MLLVISPAKTLDMDAKPLDFEPSQPEFLADSAQLIDRLRQFSSPELAQLMSLSDKLAGLNLARYQAWQPPFDATNAKPAALAFQGDVYQGLQAKSFDSADWQYAQQHLRILSGLYGILKPQDWMQAYRLEMGTALGTRRGKDLYQFWGDRLTQALLTELGSAPLINLASNEYFKAVAPIQRQAQVITPIFKDFKNGQYKIISFYAKKARGLMSHYAIKHRIQQAEQLKHFNSQGYYFCPEQSNAQSWVFLRDTP